MKLMIFERCFDSTQVRSAAKEETGSTLTTGSPATVRCAIPARVTRPAIDVL